ncbi:aspartyl/asparaginyl beta-hydroxylase domain-containing protein [Salmonella enterica subsp. enterica]|uniref:aspartyl/asparaginyl beta-hydroxylase domain-containing protein n=1 Tax=Salmonella sp. SKLX088796 TaxID=3160007 RepID=UPI00127411FC|nr:aspartyl/asparaginyl beta-hydroxylase domain-containing protein [Salmonella enterica subsp. enterica serovar Weltevreden]EBV2290666.1 aspartyl/asparaginyl beta-hydroxylase domain-containing protein [Salmonella enterica subsp. enterica serovar Weltevreden]ECE9751544.1 aspartyl/asparaginyl beta-hydroxylase domain-containing protein [Salmonella enterica subsp. enterica serovar Weltevreden]ELU6131792.1 aspartyl/asparaginyl beta-hydroxylase domain-containing protein [Salmonella enterica]
MFAAIIIGIFIISVIYAHSRGVEKQKLSRQLFDHSTFMAPINMFMTRFSTLPAKQHHIKAAQANNDAGFNTFFKRGWKRFYLKWYSDAHPSAETLCPITTKLVNSVPSIKAAMFAELPPGAYLGKHRDPYAGSVRYHLGLSTPNDDRCFIEVDRQRYSWRDGEAVIFDETYVHWAENKTEQTRIILFCDIERPMKWRWAQSVNHWVGASLMSAASSPNDENDRTGAINRIFKYVHAARDAGQRLKKKNRTLYYALKYLVIAAIFAAIILFSLL